MDAAREHVAYRLGQGMDYRDILIEVGRSFPPWSEPDRVDVEMIVAHVHAGLRPRTRMTFQSTDHRRIAGR